LFKNDLAALFYTLRMETFFELGDYFKLRISGANMKRRIADCSRSEAWRLILLLCLGFWGSVTLLAIALTSGCLPS